MTKEEAKSCIQTIELLRRLAFNIHGVMDVIDAQNCDKIIALLSQEPCEDAISRQAACDAIRKYKSVVSEPDAYDKAFDDGIDTAIAEIGHNVPPVTPQPKTGHWKIKRASIHPYGNDVACSVCGLTMGSSFGYKYCPNCGARMVEPQESEGV